MSVDMSTLARVTAVEPLGGRALRVTFSDGWVRELDLSSMLIGALACLDEDGVFAGVMVDPVAGTVAWPNGFDLDPDVLHGDDAPATGPAPSLIREYRLQQTS